MGGHASSSPSFAGQGQLLAKPHHPFQHTTDRNFDVLVHLLNLRGAYFNPKHIKAQIKAVASHGDTYETFMRKFQAFLDREPQYSKLTRAQKQVIHDFFSARARARQLQKTYRQQG